MDTVKRLLETLLSDLPFVDLSVIANKISICSEIYSRDSSKARLCEILDHLSNEASKHALVDPQWNILAGRLLAKRISIQVSGSFSKTTVDNPRMFDKNYWEFVKANATELDNMIVPERDSRLNIFSISTLLKSYLLHAQSEIIETPQYLYLRVATFLYYPELNKIKEMYDDISTGKYSHATPTLFNAGLVRHQLSSCFLMTVGDNMDSITDCWKEEAFISKDSGGVGKDINRLRHSEIGINGFSKGVVQWLKIDNEIFKAVDQGGKRNGSSTMYMRDWHIDIFEFIELKDDGPDEIRAKDLFYGLMISDLFMQRVERNENWSLFCPNKAKKLNGLWGRKFVKQYLRYESKHKYSRQVRALELWETIANMRIKKGMPFMISMDSINRKSNQKHAGVINNSNLCTEIAENTSDEEIASCTLASLCLSEYVKKRPDGTTYYDYNDLDKYTRKIVRNLNRVVDRNYYSPRLPKISYSNFRHRPLGIGEQGFADAIALLNLSWVITDPITNELTINPKTKLLNRCISEQIYYSALCESVEIAKIDGPYETFPGSPMSKGLFQFDLWTIEEIEKILPEYDGETADYTHIYEIESIINNGVSLYSFSKIDADPDIPDKNGSHVVNLGIPNLTTELLEFVLNENNVEWVIRQRERMRFSNTNITREDWEELRKDIVRFGTRNSLLRARMPTASSAHILDNTEAFEPFADLISTRTVLSGQFTLVNKHLVNDLTNYKLWNRETIANIIENRGSLQFLPHNFSKISKEQYQSLLQKYRTVWEIPQKVLLELSVDTSRFIDQTSSQNAFFEMPTRELLFAYDFYAFENGLKTWQYYLRQKARADPRNVALDSLVVSTQRNFYNIETKECECCSA